jgi:hypothetical protein
MSDLVTDPEIKLIPYDLSSRLLKMLQGRVNPVDKPEMLIELIKERKLTPEQFVALRKIVSQRKTDPKAPYRGRNIFHLATAYGKLDLNFLNSTSKKLSSEQVMKILSERDINQNSVFNYLEEGMNGINEIVIYFGLDKKTMANLFIESHRRKNSPLISFFQTAQGYKFADECAFYGISAQEYLKLHTETKYQDHSGIDYYVQRPRCITDFIKGFSSLKPCPEDYMKLYRVLNDRVFGTDFFSDDKELGCLFTVIGSYIKAIQTSPNKLIDDEKRLFDEITQKTESAPLPFDEELRVELRNSIQCIGNFRNRRLRERVAVTVISRPNHAPQFKRGYPNQLKLTKAVA